MTLTFMSAAAKVEQLKMESVAPGEAVGAPGCGGPERPCRAALGSELLDPEHGTAVCWWF